MVSRHQGKSRCANGCRRAIGEVHAFRAGGLCPPSQEFLLFLLASFFLSSSMSLLHAVVYPRAFSALPKEVRWIMFCPCLPRIS